MSLVWKLLRQHISLPQFAGFLFANLFGMTIVLLGVQLYNDILPVFTAEDSFMKSDYVVVSKQVGQGGSMTGGSSSFSTTEVEDLESKPFIEKVGNFVGNDFKVTAAMGVSGTNVLNSEIYHGRRKTDGRERTGDRILYTYVGDTCATLVYDVGQQRVCPCYGEFARKTDRTDAC